MNENTRKAIQKLSARKKRMTEESYETLQGYVKIRAHVADIADYANKASEAVREVEETIELIQKGANALPEPTPAPTPEVPGETASA